MRTGIVPDDEKSLAADCKSGGGKIHCSGCTKCF